MNPYKDYTSTDFIDMIYEYLSKTNLNQTEEKSKGNTLKYYPSSLGRCPRSIVYRMLGYIGSPMNGQVLTILDNGTAFHERMEHLFQTMGILVAKELVIKHEELKISGRTDAVIWNFFKEDENQGDISLYEPGNEQPVYEGDAKEVLLVEFKSIKDKNFEALPLSKPKKEHEMQLQLYFYLTGVNKGLVFYENKDNQAWKYYVVNRNEDMIAEILKHISDMIGFAERGELPERPYVSTDIPCRFCNYRDLCHPNVGAFSYEQLFQPEEEVPF